jgi:hypothetical protein
VVALLVLASLGACHDEPAGKENRSVFPIQPKPVQGTVTRDSGHAAAASVPEESVIALRLKVLP